MKKVSRKLLIIFVVIGLCILLGIYYLAMQRIKVSGYTLEYMNSDQIDHNVKSPTNIHVLLAKYGGSIKPKTISKFTYNFAYRVIPHYYDLIKQGKLKENDKFFYQLNKKMILAETGIDNYEDFKKLIQKIAGLNSNLEVESMIIPIDSVKTFYNDFGSQLKIKYQENDEITFDLQLGNRSNEEKTGIKLMIK